MRLSFLFSLVALALGGCGAELTPVEVRFDGLVGGEPAVCGQTYDGLGLTGDSTYTLQDFRLFVHDVRLVTEDGREVPVALDRDDVWQHRDVALLDFETGGAGCPAGTADTHTSLRGQVADPGPYTGVRFTLGVPFEQNHEDVSLAPAPLSTSAMFWSWRGGYKFIRVDGSTRALADGFFLHLGSTGCDGDPLTGGVTACAQPNRVEVALEGFDPLSEPIRVDLADVFATSDLEGDGSGCMSSPTNPTCGPIFERLGLPFGEAPAGSQRLFSVASE